MSRIDRIENWAELAEHAHFDAMKLARLCEMSYSQLRRHFVGSISQPPQEWLDELQLRRVVQLMRCSRCTLKEIADKLHFASSSHLSHKFKRYFGCPPSRFQSVRFPIPQLHAAGWPRDERKKN